MKKQTNRAISRRTLLKTALAAELSSALASCTSPTQPQSTSAPPRNLNLIPTENRKTGDKSWLLNNTRIDPKTRYRSPAIEGYCSRASVRAGDSLDLMISTNPPSPFTIDIYRTGYYAGAGARKLTTLGPFPGKTQPDPPIGPNRLRECRWEPT